MKIINPKIFFLAVALILLLQPASASLRQIDQGGIIFSGEQDLDVCSFYNASASYGAWPVGIDPASSPPVQVLGPKEGGLSCSHNFLGQRVGDGQAWYLLAADGVTPASPMVLFTSQQPSMDVAVWDADTGQDVTDKAALPGHHLVFKIRSNLNAAAMRQDAVIGKDGFVNIDLTSYYNKNPVASLYDDQREPISLYYQFVNASDFTWGGTRTWATGVKDSAGNFIYRSDMYSVRVVSTLNGMTSANSSTHTVVVQAESPPVTVKTTKTISPLVIVTSWPATPSATPTPAVVTTMPATPAATQPETPAAAATATPARQSPAGAEAAIPAVIAGILLLAGRR